MRNYNIKSSIEEYFFKKLGCRFLNEKIPVFSVDDFEMLGNFTSLRFLEWLQLNPNGVVALPTGKTPKTFIEKTINYLNNWSSPQIQNELSRFGLDIKSKPDMKTFYFVQLDEFFQIDSSANNSFAYFIDKFYMQGFGFDKNKCLLMDVCYKNSSLEDVRKFVREYEEKIKELGGIGFFLGGIGPDGHIAFNISGSDHKSRTRLLKINYQTAAAAARSFGGIDNVLGRKVVTIGLNTITQNKSVTAIIMARGKGKAKVVKDAVRNSKSNTYPATALQGLSSSRFYATNDSTILLENNIYSSISIEDVKMNIKTDLSIFNNKKILHTAPHHDDIALGYFPFIYQLTKESNCLHHFAIGTSGHRSITDSFLSRHINSSINKLSNDEKINLKTLIREEEELSMWSNLGFSENNITNLRLPFYDNSNIDFRLDVLPVINLIKGFDPDIITVCEDPEGVGPGTHFKFLQIMRLAIREVVKDMKNKERMIFGYRNVWSKFELNESNLFIPVSSDDMFYFSNFFKKSYKSQIKASFPSIEFDKPFNEISSQFMVDQYVKLRKILGLDFFKRSPIQKISDAVGICCIKSRVLK